MTKFATVVTACAVALGLFAITAPAGASPLNPTHKACFFTGVGFTGQSFCAGVGQRKSMPKKFTGKISSVQIIGNVSASLCTGRARRGTCKTFSEDRWQVPSPFHNNARSFQVQANHSTGTMVAKTDKHTDLSISAGAGQDLDGIGRVYVVAPDPAYRDVRFSWRSGRAMLQPVNGAQLAWGMGKNRTEAQCAKAGYSSSPLHIRNSLIGKYICVKTNADNYGKIQIKSLSDAALGIRYTHWPR